MNPPLMYFQTNNYFPTKKDDFKDNVNCLAGQIFAQIKSSYYQYATIKQFLVLMENQQKQYSELSYKSNESFTLVLKAKKNKTTQVCLKIFQYEEDSSSIENMLREYSILQSLKRSDYFISINNQFYLTEENENNEESAEQNQNTVRRFFVQEIEFSQGTLRNIILEYRNSQMEIPENLKENFVIQMLDSINMLHSRGLIHSFIRISSFSVSENKLFQVVLKLRKLRFAFPASLSKSRSLQSQKRENVYQAPETLNNEFCIESDLFSFGLVILQLDNICTFDLQNVTYFELDQLLYGRIFIKHQLNRSSLLYKIASTFLQYSPTQRSSAHEMLLTLINKSKYNQQIKVFSISTPQISTTGYNYCSHYQNMLPQYNTYFTYQIINRVITQLDVEEQNGKQLTIERITSALKIIISWKIFGTEYDLLGTGANGIVLGVENLKLKRQSALKLQLCLNKAEIIREISIMKICQTPYIVTFYGHYFFEDNAGNQFVIFELERCKYSLTYYLEQQRVTGAYSEKKKYSLMQQIIDSVNYIHQQKILHGDLKLDNFLITEDQDGEIFVKLTDFDQARVLVSDQQGNQYQSYLQDRGLQRSHINCSVNNNKKGTLLYYAPERWRNGSTSTYQADSFSVGLILILLDNYLVFSEDQLLRKFCSFTKPYSDLAVDRQIPINTGSAIYVIAKGLLQYQMSEREGVRDKIKELRQSIPLYSKTQKFPIEDNCLQQNKSLNFERIEGIQISQCLAFLNKATDLLSISLNLSNNQIKDFQVQSLLSLLTNFNNLRSISLNLSHNEIGIGGQSPFPPFTNLNNLASISLNLESNKIGDSGAQFLLSPFSNTSSLSVLYFDLSSNNIGDLGAQSLLSPLANIINITTITLILKFNKIEVFGAQSLLSSLSNLINLASISLDLRHNKIGDLGAYALLFPLTNLSNLGSISLNLEGNQIGEFGVSSLLYPLTNLKNLFNFSLNLSLNKIGNRGAQLVLSPLSNLTNLSSIQLDLRHNQIGDVGVSSLLSPLANLSNLGNLQLDLESNQITEVGVKSLLSPLANLKNLGSISLNLWLNTIRDEGAQNSLLPLIKLRNLESISLQFGSNEIGDLGAQTLLKPLTNITNIVSLTLKLEFNKIGAAGAQDLLSPLTNLSNLTTISLDLRHNKIGDFGAKQLLSPLTNLINLVTVQLDLRHNEIGNIGAQSLLPPLAQLCNISSIELNLLNNRIGSDGAQYLLSPLSNLNNLASISISLWSNEIGDIGAQYLLYPLQNLNNLTSISINLQVNNIGVVGVESLLSLLAIFRNLKNIQLDLRYNEYEDLEDQSLFSLLTNLRKIPSKTLDFEKRYQALFGSYFNFISNSCK